jgi:hypothetical protein
MAYDYKYIKYYNKIKNNLLMMDSNCRLCDGLLTNKFSKKLLKKYSVNFYECEECKSLQTEKPYWLEEAYADWLTNFDTGVYGRVSKTFLVSFTICKLFKLKNVLDYGGGDGLFCRIMRDYYLNCFSYDKFSKNIYSKEFLNRNFTTPDLLTSYEAAEHFSQPMEEFKKIFALKPKIFLMTTAIYKNQGQNWDYLEADTGQHIFFYSKKSLEFIAKKFNYKIIFLECGFILMLSKKTKINNLLVYLLKKILIRQKMLSLLKFILIFFKSDGYEKDYNSIKNQ